MRDILFKAKCVDSGEWVKGDLVTLHYPKRLCIASKGNNQNWSNTEFIEVDPATVCQFTGLLDKSGKRIFEGDITNDGYVIKYWEKKALFTEFFLDRNSPASYPIESGRIEIIGSIHDVKEGM